MSVTFCLYYILIVSFFFSDCQKVQSTKHRYQPLWLINLIVGEEAPESIGGMLQFFDFNQASTSRKLFGHKRHNDGENQTE